MNELGNHLWQSTVFAAASAVCCWLLRRHRARVRHWIWFAASLKFLVPFVLLLAVGARLERPKPETLSTPRMSATRVEQISLSFAPVPSIPAPKPKPHRVSWLPVLAAVWLGGAAFVAGRWLREWNTLRNLRRSATPLALDFAVPVLSSSAAIEPGIFGIVRPVLLLPEGLEDRLDAGQLHSILAHELCHVRSHDNLTGALQMLVQALFWFHPAVWWIGSRLMEERERACDEAVLGQGQAADVYAQGILNVCKFYASSPLPCASGVTGADLKKRIREIMTGRIAQRLSTGGKVVLAGAAIAAALLPVAIGILRAQTLPPAPQYTYDVVSIHKSAPNEMSSQIGPGPQGGLKTHNVSIMQLITFAYDMRPNQVIGAPGWTDTERYDISFTPDKPETPPAPGQGRERLEGFFNRQRQRMQAVLRDRFGLVLRAETRDLPMYGLVVAKGGPKLPANQDGKGPNFRMSRGEMNGTGVYLDMFANGLASLLGRFVKNETGLTGAYDFTLKYTPDAAIQLPVGLKPGAEEGASSDGDSGNSIFTALQEQLGLKLESKKGPVPVLVVEKIDRATEN